MNMNASGAQPAPDGDRIPPGEDRRVLHPVGRNIEWLYDPNRFPGWATKTASPLTQMLTSQAPAQPVPTGGASRTTTEPPLLGAPPAQYGICTALPDRGVPTFRRLTTS